MYRMVFILTVGFVIGEEDVTSSATLWGSCHRYSAKEIFHFLTLCFFVILLNMYLGRYFIRAIRAYDGIQTRKFESIPKALSYLIHALQLICPLDYDTKCNDPIMDPYGAFKYRCQTVYPHDEKLNGVEIMNASTLLRIIQHTDTYKRMWCMIALFFAPTCPFSARIAPYFNALPKIYNGSIKFIALDATEFSKLNSRYGISGTPTVMLWVSGAAVARMEDRSLNDNGLMDMNANFTNDRQATFQSFIYDWTDVSPVFGSIRSMDDPLHIEFDDRPDLFYLSLSLFVAYIVVLYVLRDRICENIRVRNALAWISARIDDLSGYFAVHLRAEL